MAMVRELFPMPLLLVGASTPVEEGLPSRPGSTEVESPLRADVPVCAHDEHDDGDERESPVEVEVPGRVVDLKPVREEGRDDGNDSDEDDCGGVGGDRDRSGGIDDGIDNSLEELAGSGVPSSLQET